MFRVEVKLDDIQSLNDRLAQLAKGEFERLLDELAGNIAKTFLSIVTGRTPVDTGFLRGNWDIKRTPDGYLVYNTTVYGIYVNYGHRTRNGGLIEGQFFVEKSVKTTEENIIPIVKESLIKPLERYLNG